MQIRVFVANLLVRAASRFVSARDFVDGFCDVLFFINKHVFDFGKETKTHSARL